MDFSEIKNRDAWSTIRGFVYQVDLTIQRWLSLEPDQVLELEKGEDIDIVRKGIEGQEIERELEQIKFRESSASLNQKWILEILLNFYLHKQNNITKRVCFRFVTNSDYTMERPSIFKPLQQKGIDAWNQISQADDFDDSIKLVQDRIKLFLQKKIKSLITVTSGVEASDNTTNLNWSNFHDFIADDNELFKFIKDFQWSFRNDDQTNISETIKKRLETQGIARDKESSEAIYSRLFLYVFKKLCISTEKTLDLDDLTSQTLLPELSQNDIDLQSSINQLLFSFGQRLDVLEDEVGTQRIAISLLSSDVLQIQKSDAVFDYRLDNLTITPPRPVRNASKRQQKVVDILTLFEKHSWVSIQGINGTGKSQLASSIFYTAKEDQRFWLDLRAYNDSPEKTVLLIEAYLKSISRVPVHSNRSKWLQQISQVIPKQSLIILNDLPRVDEDSALCNLFCALIDSFAEKGIRVLTTSNHEIPTRTQQLLSTSNLSSYKDLDFSNEEIIEYFTNCKASEFINTYVNLIVLLSHRNPSIIGAMLGYLEKINWGDDSVQLIEVILKKEFSKEILENAQLLISKNITDEKSKELLYRLSFVHWEFELELVKCVGAVPEEITHPNEKLTNLLNVWIQSYDNSYQISPLIYDIGEKNLSDSVVEQVHISIAESILATKKINQINASRCIKSFIKGKDYDKAGMTLLTTYNSALDKSNAEHLLGWGYLNYWIKDDIPKQMNFTLRVQLRLEQARLNKLTDNDDVYFFSRLKEYSTEIGISVNDKILVDIAMLQNYDKLSLSDFWHHFKNVAQNYNFLDEQMKIVVKPKVFVPMLWFPVSKIKSDIDVRAWFELVKLVKDQFKIELLKSSPAQMAITLMSEQVVYRLNENGEHNWPEKLQTLSYMQSSLESMGYEILSAIALKQIIAVEFEKNTNVQKAIEVTEKGIHKYSSIEAQYFLCENIGKLYCHKKHYDAEAIKWLSKAVEYNCESQLNFIETQLYYASVLAPTDKQKALIQCINAKRLSESGRNTDELFHLKVLGELGLSYWLNDDLQKCFECFELLVTKLFAMKDKYFGKRWIKILKFTGHALGYLAGESNGSVPNIIKGGEEYFKPFQGMIALSTGDVSDLYEKKNDPIIMAQLAILSDGIGNIEKASEWSQKAFDFARRNEEQSVFLLLSSQLSKYLVLTYKVAEAIETSILFSAVTYHKDEFKTNDEAFDNVNLQKLYESKPSEKWNLAEHAVITYTVIPLFIRALLYRIENTEQSKDKCQEFKDAVFEYYDTCSDRELWGELILLSTGILDSSMSGGELFNRVIHNQGRGWSSIQIIGIIGLLANTPASEKHLEYLLNILPQVVNSQKNLSFNLISNIVAPFVKIIGTNILKNIFVGDKQTLHSIISQIEDVDTRQVNCIQKILIPIIEMAEIEIPTDKEEWLFE